MECKPQFSSTLLQPLNPVSSAQLAGLRYADGNGPGIRRRRSGTGFAFITNPGKPVHNARVLRRIRSLAVRPAWTDVGICPWTAGHQPTSMYRREELTVIHLLQFHEGAARGSLAGTTAFP